MRSSAVTPFVTDCPVIRMVKTNQWTVAELMKYLASIRSTLSDEELGRLRNTAAFSKELTEEGPDGLPNRYQARQLYEPLDVFRKLQLPVLAWGQKVKWRGSSDEGVCERFMKAVSLIDIPTAKLLFDIGLQRSPPLGTIISLCTDQDTEVSHPDMMREGAC